MGRYPGDHYDGDTKNPVPGGHPWALCTCNFAELYYRLANAISESTTVPFDDKSARSSPRSGNRQYVVGQSSHGPAKRGRPHAASSDLSQRSPGTERAIRRHDRI